MVPARIIERKRDGAVLDAEEVHRFFTGFLDDRVDESQMSAFLMAVFFRGLEPSELAALVEVMIASGQPLDFPEDPDRPVVDKHSTGGVGDKVSLVLAPLAAELGLRVPMMSGRGLGHTGGTLDKLESIPGLRTDLAPERIARGVEELGVAMVGQTPELAPLDRRLYALRDVTGTVASLPLIAASIMSKKIAEGLDALVLDVKVGSGAFLPDEDRAIELAETMVGLGGRHGVRTVALLTAMDRPLGRMIGNALEVREALDVLRGDGPEDLRNLALVEAAEMIAIGDSRPAEPADLERARTALDSGSALERFRAMVAFQGGDASALDRPDGLPSAPVRRSVPSARGGVVTDVAPRPLGHAVIELGGGRKTASDRVDAAVGIEVLVRPGLDVRANDALAIIHARTESEAEIAANAVRAAVRVADACERAPLPLVASRVGSGGRELDPWPRSG